MSFSEEIVRRMARFVLASVLLTASTLSARIDAVMNVPRPPPVSSVAWKPTLTRRGDDSSSGLRFRCPEPRIVGVQTFGKAAQMLHRIVGQLEMGVAR